MKRARLSTGFELELDGDLLGVLEALYREVTLRLHANARPPGLVGGRRRREQEGESDQGDAALHRVPPALRPRPFFLGAVRRLM